MKRLIIVLALIMAISTSTWVRTQSQPPHSEAASLSGQLERSYETLTSLTRDAAEIVIVEVVDSTPKPFANLPFTEVTVRVEETLKGTATPRSLLNILETGGPWAGRPKGDKSDRPVEVREVSFEGVPVMKMGEKYILFLVRYSGPITADAYRPLGVYQGKFKVAPTGVIEFNGNRAELSEPNFAVLRSVDGRLASNVVAEIRMYQQ